MRARFFDLTKSLPTTIPAVAVSWLNVVRPTLADPVTNPGNVIIVILDDVSTDELPIYNGYPLTDSCDTECACPESGPAACSPCTGSDGNCAFPAMTLPVTSDFLDGLAETGVVFRSAYSNTGCSQTRATMQRGRYGFRTGIGSLAGAQIGLSTNEQTIADVLKGTAYDTAAIGKWHLSGDPQCGSCGPVKAGGFDYYAGATGAFLTNYCSWQKVVISGPATAVPSSCTSTTQRVYATAGNVDDAIRWICQLPACGDGHCSAQEVGQCSQDCPPNCPNGQCAAPENHLNCPQDCSPPACGNGTCDLGEDHCTCADCADDFDLPPNCNPRANFFIWLAFNAPHNTGTDGDNRVPCGPGSCAFSASTPCGELTTDRDTFNEMVRIADCELRRLRLALEAIEADQLGQNNTSALDATTFIVVGDNGSTGTSHWPQNHQKGSVYEGGVRVPLIVGGKNVEPGQSGPRFSDALINTVDIFATALDLMGVDVATAPALSGVELDAESFVPILVDNQLDNPDPPIREFAYVEQFSPSCAATWDRAIRNDQHKLIQFCPAATGGGACFDTGNCTEELYTVEDVLECCELSGQSGAESIKQELRDLITALMLGEPDDVQCTTREGDTCMGCCAIDPYYGLTVEWVGPTGNPPPEPQPRKDYDAYNIPEGSECVHRVVVKTTEKNGQDIQQYIVGGGAQGNPRSIGAVQADWLAPADQNIRVQVGDKDVGARRVADVSKIDIDPQAPGTTWSNAILGLLGDLGDLLKVSEVGTAGGRISGEIDGSARTIDAYAIGVDASTPGDLTVGTPESTSVIALDNHPVGSTLTFTGYVPSGARVKVTGASGFVGNVVTDDWFDGQLCADNLLNGSAQSIPSNINVAFGTSGQVCEKTCTTCVTPCPDALSTTVPETTVVAKNRFISFSLSGATDEQFAIRVTLDDLPSTETPPGFPDVSAFEGQHRWVNSFGGTVTCPDSVTAQTDFKCATLGCDAEYRDWDTDIGSSLLHVTGSAVMPHSTYSVRAWLEEGGAYACRSPALSVPPEFGVI